MPRVSVIIPSYNHEKYIEECLQSVLDQRFQDFEIIVVDDGSTDGTVKKIRACRDPRIRLVCFEKNRGACVAANTCLDLARGEYIAMLSSDDAFLPEKLMMQVECLERHPQISVVFGFANIVGEDGECFAEGSHHLSRIFRQSNRSRHDWLRRLFCEGNCLCHPSALIRRELYDEVGRYDERMANIPDYDLWVRTCLRREIHVLPEALIRFRVRTAEANASGCKPETHVRANFEMIRMLSHYRSLPTWDEYARVFPDAKGDAGPRDAVFVPFYVAQQALKVDSAPHQLFGLTTIFELCGNPWYAKRLESEVGFSFSDLIRLTAQFDIFRPVTYPALAQRLEAMKVLNRRWWWRCAHRLLGLDRVYGSRDRTP